MIHRRHGFLELRRGDAPEASRALEERGFAVLPGVLSTEEVEALAADVERVFDEYPMDDRPSADRSPGDDMFRYEMLNRSALCQQAAGHPAVLEAIEPLLGEDCHVIANTAWRNPKDQAGAHGGEIWHIDAGPHVPRPPGTPWPDDVPYPVFAIGSHFLLMDSRLEDGPTGAIPGSHRSGQHPPFESLMDETLRFEGAGCEPLLGRAGDVLLFVSDCWHRRMPSGPGARGRFFLQVHYGRRDIAQRLRLTGEAGQVSAEAAARAKTPRERTLIGLHDPQFYDG